MTDSGAVYRRGMDLYLQENNAAAALECLMKAAKTGYKAAFGEIGLILYREQKEPKQAEKWFEKAEKTDSLFPMAAHGYGMLHYLENGNWKKGLGYLFQSAKYGLVCDMPHRTKPNWQWFASSVHNSSRSHRSLCPTFRTMEQSPASLPNFPCLATRTNKAIRPSQLLEIFQADSLGAKLFLKFNHCTRVIFLHIQEHYILWPLESSAYPRMGVIKSVRRG